MAHRTVDIHWHYRRVLHSNFLTRRQAGLSVKGYLASTFNLVNVEAFPIGVGSDKEEENSKFPRLGSGHLAAFHVVWRAI